VRLRVRTATDLPVLGAVLREVHETAGYPTRWPADPQRWLAAKAGCGAWVAEAAGGLCGHVGLHQVQERDCRLAWLAVTGLRPDRLAEVSRLFVAPQAMGLGVGRHLLQQAVQAAHALGAWPVLDVVADGRTAAERLYRACGWRFAGRESWSPGDGRELPVNCWTGPPPAR
jgi:GNAT superfamily N-acetyltransferase